MSDISLKNRHIRKTYEYWYLVLMVVYMAQMTSDTSRMVGEISGNPISFFLPILATIILIKRNNIDFRYRKLWKIIGLFTIWSLIIIYKLGIFSSSKELSYYFFLFYAIFIAYIHNRVYGHKLLRFYEDIMVQFAKISLFFWGFSIIFPNSASSFFRLFEPTGFGRNFMYIYDWMDPDLGQQTAGLLRNAGCSWEPGRFAVMLCLAIVGNLSFNGLNLKRNYNLYWLIGALITTFSTTGYSILLIIFCIFTFRKFTIKTFIFSLLVILPSIYFVMGLDFMGNKIEGQVNVEEKTEVILKNYEWVEANMDKNEGVEKGYLHAIDRFPSIYLELQNIEHDPILGYGLNVNHSYLVTHVSSLIFLCGGFAQIFGKYGLLLGLFIFYILLQSSAKIAKYYRYGNKFAIFICLILSSISYPIWCIPVYTSIWLFSLFEQSKK